MGRYSDLPIDNSIAANDKILMTETDTGLSKNVKIDTLKDWIINFAPANASEAEVKQIVGAMISAGTGTINVAYNPVAGTITLSTTDETFSTALKDKLEALPNIHVGKTAPSSPSEGDLWVDTN